MKNRTSADEIFEQIKRLRTKDNAELVDSLLADFSQLTEGQVNARSEYWRVAEDLKDARGKLADNDRLIDALYVEILALRDMLNPDGSPKANLRWNR